MRLNWKNRQGDYPRSVALGTFDGVHIGHQELLNQAIALRPNSGCSSVFTFDVPPEQFFKQDFRMLCSFDHKVAYIREFGIDEVAWVSFNDAVARIDPEQFIREVLAKELHAKHVICGFNFRFGYQGRGDIDLLQELSHKYGYAVTIVPPVQVGQVVVSSTHIREAVASGNIERAAEMLGKFPRYNAAVVLGAGRGRKLGFPTANLNINPNIVLPGEGVYVTWCIVADGKGYPSVTSIGKNPTFDGSAQTVETYILDFSGDLYNQSIEIQFLHRLRDIVRYHSVEQLRAQIQNDVESTRRLITGFHLQETRIVLE